MVSKSDNKKTVTKKIPVAEKPGSKDTAATPKATNEDLDEDDDMDELDADVVPKSAKAKPASKSKKSNKEDDDDDDADVEEEKADDWEKPEEDENWDPDFEEFDVPKSKEKKAGSKKNADDDDLKMDDDFKEFGLFDDMEGAGAGFDDEDDY